MAQPPWSDHQTRIDGSALEATVSEILDRLGRNLPSFRAERQEPIRTADGEYRIDVTLRFEQLGVAFLVLVECKEHRRPVEREDVQILADKVRAAGAQKGILFATNGFQRGAIEYARAHGIALVRVVDGALTYETRADPSAGPRPAPPQWANIPPFVGQLVTLGDGGSVHVSVVDRSNVDYLRDFIMSA